MQSKPVGGANLYKKKQQMERIRNKNEYKRREGESERKRERERDREKLGIVLICWWLGSLVVNKSMKHARDVKCMQCIITSKLQTNECLYLIKRTWCLCRLSLLGIGVVSVLLLLLFLLYFCSFFRFVILFRSRFVFPATQNMFTDLPNVEYEILLTMSP